MIEAVFISDLHLNPDQDDITERFKQFIQWARHHTKNVYILGDFFHVWPGDDALDPWSESIAALLSSLTEEGIKVYFMPGNRDFLLGKRFAKLAHIILLKEPTLIVLDGVKVALVHGDRYCIKDTGHLWLRRLTRNRIFPRLFLSLPYPFRLKLVNELRRRSQTNRTKPKPKMDVIIPFMLDHMQKLGVTTLIHGHTHNPGLTTHTRSGMDYKQYILSDWDDTPLIMCYDSPMRFYFTRMPGECNASE